MRQTMNLLLKLPDYTDFVNIEDINENTEVIDEKLGKILNGKTIKVKRNVTILPTGWVDDTANSGLFIYNINDADITANTVVDVNVHLLSLDAANPLKSATESFDGYARIYADEKPTSNIVADLKLIRELVV